MSPPTPIDGLPEDPGIALDSRRGRLLLTNVVLGTSVASLTATVVNVALPVLADDLAAGSAAQKWIVNGYTLTLASFILIGGSLGDRLGRVRVYRLGLVWFAVASLLCAVAPNDMSLIVFRLLQGVGGALLTPGSLAIIQSTLRRDDRGRAVGAWSGMTGVAAAIGPLIGGLLVDVSWRWVFVVNVPIAVAAVVLSAWTPETRDPRAEDSRIDVAGAIITAVVLAGASYALIEGPERGWSVVEIVAACTAVMAAAFLWRVERSRTHPMLPLELFGDRVFAVANVLTLVIYGGMGVLFFLLPLQLQVTAGWSALAAGAALVPVTALMLLLSSRIGDLAARIGPRLPLSLGPLVVAAGMLLTTRIGSDATYLGDLLPAMIVFGLGLSAIAAPVTSAALGSVPDDRAGTASGVNNAVARTGGLVAVAAIPSLVGLTGDALSEPDVLGSRFDRAMWLAAALVGAAGVGAFALLRPDDRSNRPDDAQHHPCPVDGQLTSPRHPTSIEPDAG